MSVKFFSPVHIAFFWQVGEVAHVELFKDSDGRPRGTAIVEFSSKEHVEEAIKIVDKKEWKGRKLSVKEAVDAERDKFGNIIKAGKECVCDSTAKYLLPWMRFLNTVNVRKPNVQFAEPNQNKFGYRSFQILDIRAVRFVRFNKIDHFININ